MELINKIKFGFIALYFILILVIERFYYDKLFNESLEMINICHSMNDER